MTLLGEISSEPETKTIIFVETKRRVDEITRAVCRNGWRAVAIHGQFNDIFQKSFPNFFFAFQISRGFLLFFDRQATKLNRNVTMF